MSNFVELAQNQQASEFQDTLNQVMADKVAAALLDKKAEVASRMFGDAELATEGSEESKVKRFKRFTQKAKSKKDLDEETLVEFEVKKGAFHKWLGKSEDEPITAADIAKGKAAGGHAAKMATFAQNFGHGK